MKLRKTLSSICQTLHVLKHQNPSLPSTNPRHASNIHLLNSVETTPSLNSLMPISLFQRNLSTSAQLVSDNVIEEQEEVESKSTHSDGGEEHLEVRQNGVVEFSEKIGEKRSSVTLIDSKLKEIQELKKKLHNLEKEVKGMKGYGDHNRVKNKKKNVKSLELEEQPKLVAQTKPTSLHAVFTSKPRNLSDVNAKKLVSNKVLVGVKQEQVSSKVKPEPVKEKDRRIMKELSPEMATLALRLHQGGYFDKMRFGIKEFDLNAFPNKFTRDLLRGAAEKFGQDHQELAKWLSGSDMKKVVLSGCPSVEKNTVFAAKSLRTFFHIQEDIVCRGCKMKSSCKFVNKKVWREKEKLNLADAMRVLVSYSLGSAPQEEISQEVKASVDKLLQDVINLSQ